jgi:hypothetical protein
VATITDIGRDVGFKGTRYHKSADLGVNTKYTIDFSSGARDRNVHTSVDCYVAGSYMGFKGNRVDIIQRYTIFVAYSKETQLQAMTAVRQRIMDDFSSNYPQFKIDDIFIPDAKFTAQAQMVEDEQFYHGSQLWKNISRIDVARYHLETEKQIYKQRVGYVKKRYGI